MKLILFSMLVMCALANARITEVTCVGRGCLIDGWLIVNEYGRVLAETTCIDSDCHNKGWEVEYRNGFTITAECRGGSCLDVGYTERDGRGRILQDVLCSKDSNGNPSCLGAGWESFFTNGRATVTCKNNDCRTQGWVAVNNWGNSAHIHCKDNQCFEKGWMVFE